MTFLKRYLLPRLLQYGLVIWLGITVVFIIPRLLPHDPVEQMVDMMQMRGNVIDPAATERTIQVMRELYGLEAGLLNQYVSFWGRLVRLDFGPSMFAFPTPVVDLVAVALPWTVGLLATTLVLSWVIGNLLGGLAGYFSRSRVLKAIDGVVMCLRPLPYYNVAMLLIIFFVYLLGLFPLGGGYSVGGQAAFSWRFVLDVLRHAFLPALSLVILGAAVNHQTMRLLVQNVKEDDYVRYAKLGNVREGTIFTRYVMRNASLPQITALAMSFGLVFDGALITEIVFSYPGMGYLLFRSLSFSDYNMIMGITSFSIIGIATGILIIDLLYPLLDPRIRLR